MTPINDRIILKRIETKEPERLVIAVESSKKKSTRGEVLEVGPGKFVNGKRQPMQVNKGDIVVFGEFAGHDIIIDGENYTVVREDEIILVL